MPDPIICFGQQPCGIFPKRFLFAKIQTARRLQREIGGTIAFFYHDSDHDPRETVTVLKDRSSGERMALNFEFENKIQKLYSPLYLKRVVPGWKAKMERQLPSYVDRDLVEKFKGITRATAADLCLAMYAAMGLMKGIKVVRSSDPNFRAAACAIDDYFVDLPYEGEIVRARARAGKFWLHKGGDKFIEVPAQTYGREQVSATRDTRFRWMQSVIGCTHYVSGASEQDYVNKADGPGVIFVERKTIADSGDAYISDHE
ncbi:MAG TPA: hypothetical protein VEI58_07480 [Chthoniobacterales bacterium]|nr:hypothetical protein [Chthoniobacterales bacterium]